MCSVEQNFTFTQPDPGGQPMTTIVKILESQMVRYHKSYSE